MVIRSRKSKKERQRNGKKGQAMLFKTLHRKPKIEQHELPKIRLCRQVPGMVSSFCSACGSRFSTQFNS